MTGPSIQNLGKRRRRWRSAVGGVILAFALAMVSIAGGGFSATAATLGVPEILNHQGRLLDTNSNLLGGTGTSYCFRFSIYDNATVGSGTKLWPSGTPSTMTVTVTSGVFNVGIGDTGAGGDVLDYNFQDNDTVYLQVEVENSSGGSCAAVTFGSEDILSPRQRVFSSGYALNADTVDGLHANATATASRLLALNASGSFDLGTGGVSTTRATTTSLIFSADGANVAGFNDLYLSSGSLFFDGVNISSGGSAGTSGAWEAFGSGALTPTSTSRGILVHASSTIQGGLVMDGNATATGRFIIGTTQPTGNIGAGDLFIGGDATTTGSFAIGASAANDDDYLFLDDGVAEALWWDDSPGQFQLTDDLLVSGNATTTGNLEIGIGASYASTTNLVLGNDGSNLGGYNDLYVNGGNLFFNGQNLGSSGGPGAWEQSATVANALSPTSTSNGLFVTASSTIAANFRVDGNATTTLNLSVLTGLALGTAQPRSTTTAIFQDTWAFGDSTTSALFIAAPTTTSVLTGLGPASAYYGIYVEDNPQIASTTYALYATGGQIVQTAGQIKHAGKIDLTGLLVSPFGITVQGRYAYAVSKDGDNLVILDISSSTGTPVLAGSITDDGTTELDEPKSVVVLGRYAYVTGNVDDGLEIVDISDPTRPVHVGAIASSTAGSSGPQIYLNGPGGVAIQGRYAYVTANSSDAQDGVEIIDISDPANPRHVGSIQDTATTRLDGASDIAVVGRYAYVTAATDDGLEVLDISDPANPQHVGSVNTSLNSTQYLTVEGKYAYVISVGDDGVLILDISDPANPRQVGSITNSNATALDSPEKIVVRGRYAYVASFVSGGVEVLDVSVPTNPRHVAAITDNATTEMGGAFGLAIQGKFLYVTGNSDNGVEVLDISGLDVPAANIGSLAASQIDVWQGVNIAGWLNVGSGLNVSGATMLSGAFSVGSSTASLLHVDPVGNGVFIATSTAAQTLSTWSGNALVVGGHTLIDGNTTTTGSLVIGSLLANNDDYLFFDDGWTEALWWDDSPGQFQLTDSLIINNNATTTLNLTIQGNTALGTAQPRSTTTAIFQDTWAFGDSTTSALFIAAPTTTAVLSGLGPQSAYYGIYVEDNPQIASTTYALYATGGQIVQTAGQIKHAGKFTDDSVTVMELPYDLAIQGRYAYVAAFGNVAKGGIEIFDLSSATGTPVHVGANVDNGSEIIDGATGIAVAGRYAYLVSNADSGFSVIDVSDPTRPVVIGQITDNATTELSGPIDVAIQGQYAYVTGNSDSGVEILDISDPTNPRHVGAITDNATTELSGAEDITVQGRFAYVTGNGDNGVEILDISDPTNPRHVGAITDDATTLLTSPRDIVVVGKYAYVTSSGSDGLEILDISDPTNPRHVGAITDNVATALDGAWGLTVQGRYAYISATTENGIEVLDISNPTNPVHVAAIFDTTTTELGQPRYGVVAQGRFLYVAAYGDDGIEVLDISGLDVPAANIGSLAASQIDVWQGVNIAGWLNVGSGLNVSGATMLSGAFSVGSSTASLLHVDPVGNGVFIATSTAAQTLSTWSGNALVVGGHTLIDGNTTTTGSLVIGSLLANNDDYLFFDDGWTEALWWDDSPGQFQLTDDLEVSGNATATGRLVVGSPSSFNASFDSGSVAIQGTYYNNSTANNDYAETVNVSEVVSPGDVLSIDPDRPRTFRRTDTAYDPLAVGVVSTNPAYIITASDDLGPLSAPLAMAGRVPVQVTGENGPIRIGDALTSSSLAGHAMRACGIKRCERMGLIGVALDPFGAADATATGTIQLLVGAGEGLAVNHDPPRSPQLATEGSPPPPVLPYDSLAGLDGISLWEGWLTIHGGLRVEVIGTPADTLTVASDTIFFGRPYFTTDTAGFAAIPAGQTQVDVVFDREYLEQPVVTASLTLDENPELTATATPEVMARIRGTEQTVLDAVFGGNVRYVVARKNVRGFSLLLNAPVQHNLTFSWIALAVTGAKTFIPASGTDAGAVGTPASTVPTVIEPAAPPPEPTPSPLGGSVEPAPISDVPPLDQVTPPAGSDTPTVEPVETVATPPAPPVVPPAEPVPLSPEPIPDIPTLPTGVEPAAPPSAPAPPSENVSGPETPEPPPPSE